MNADRDLRDPELDALLREHSAETPPGRVDAAILAAAHRAVRDEGRRDERAMARSAWRWWMPLAAAAMAGVVVIGVLPLAPMTPDEASPVVSDSPATPPGGGAAVVPDAAPRETAVGEHESPAAASSDAREHDRASRRSEPKAVTPPAAPPASRAPPEVQDRSEHAMPQMKSDSARPLSRATNGDQPAGLAATETPSPASPAPPNPRARVPAPDAAVSGQRSTKLEGATVRAREQGRSDAREPGSAERIARIRALRDEGKLGEAIRELNAFRAAFEDADARLPNELRSWAQTIAR